MNTSHNASPDNQPDELASYLEALSRDDCYRVERILKDNAAESTQLVYFRGANGSEQGPYVRKYITRDSGIGGAYRKLYDAQQAGQRFRYLPRIFECVDAGERLCVVMEYVVGRTLRDAVESTDVRDRLELARRTFPELCAAVSELHESLGEPVVHRDVTPGNVVVSVGTPISLTLIDLGIARTWHEGASADTTHFGTKPYAPPEQFGFAQTDVRTDVYALGMDLLFCLVGRDPRQSDRQVGFALPGVPEALRLAIAKAAALDPGVRYASARELAVAASKAFASVAGEGADVAAAPGSTYGGARSQGSAAAKPAPSAAPAPGPEPSNAPGATTVLHPSARHARHADDIPVTTPLSSPVASPRPARSRRARSSWGTGTPQALLRLGGRVPQWVGKVWNAILALYVVLLVAGCFGAFVTPLPDQMRFPSWYLGYEFILFTLPGGLLMLRAMSDRRRFRNRWLVWQGLGRELVILFGGSFLNLIFFAIVSNLMQAITGIPLVAVPA